ncbi:hypothetical protein BTH160X_40085 [Brochothrix thermosphacta]|nr:hypothetical protein BTH160X_40085 [Brochothrix thermosphacta]
MITSPIQTLTVGFRFSLNQPQSKLWFTDFKNNIFVTAGWELHPAPKNRYSIEHSISPVFLFVNISIFY